MDITPFEQLRVSTMTLIVKLTASINPETAFLLLPVTRIDITQTRKSSKCKLPHCLIPGAILSLRLRNNIRGVIPNNSRPFKNSVTLDISTTRKNINLKLSDKTVQMCGASSMEDGIEAATHIINHLRHLQAILDKIHSNKESALEIIEWIKTITLGETLERVITRETKIGNITLDIENKILENAIARPMISIPTHFDLEVTRFFLTLVDDFIYHKDMCQKLDAVMKITQVADAELEIQQVDQAMVNYNYPLGFEIDRSKLDRYINGREGFVSHFDNAIAIHVTIELPYEPPPGRVIKRRKNKVPHSTFLVYKSGSVTQSGPGGDIMRDAYYKFRTIINELRPVIQL